MHTFQNIYFEQNKFECTKVASKVNVNEQNPELCSYSHAGDTINIVTSPFICY